MADHGYGNGIGTIDPNLFNDMDFNNVNFGDIDFGNISDDPMAGSANQGWQEQNQLPQFLQPQEGYNPMQPTPTPTVAPAPQPAGKRYHFDVGWYIPYVEGYHDSSQLEYHEIIKWHIRTTGPPPPGSSNYTSSVNSMDQDVNSMYPPPGLAANNPYPTPNYGQTSFAPMNQQFTAPPNQAPLQPQDQFQGQRDQSVPQTSRKPAWRKGPKSGLKSGKAGKYGPGAYIREQKQRRAEGDNTGPRPVSRQSYDYGGPRRPQFPGRVEKSVPRTRHKPGTILPNNILKLIKDSLVANCTCLDAQQAQMNHVPRPKNAFIIFRSEFSRSHRPAKGENRGINNTQVSKDAGAQWRALTASQKAPYERAAKAESDRIKALNPGYRYDPGAKIAAKFGNQNCECGAFELNRAALVEAGSPRSVVRALSSFGVDVSDGANASGPRAPVANMYSAQQHQNDEDDDEDAAGEDEDDYGTPYAPGGRRRNQQPMQFDSRPTPTRRSSRHANKNVSYTEPDEDDSVFMPQYENDDGQTTPTRANPKPSPRHRPAAIATAEANEGMEMIRNFQETGFNFDDFINPEDTINVATTPRQNPYLSPNPSRRRSKSRSLTPPSATMRDPTPKPHQNPYLSPSPPDWTRSRSLIPTPTPSEMQQEIPHGAFTEFDDLFSEGDGMDIDEEAFSSLPRRSSTPQPMNRLALPSRKPSQSTERMTRSQASKSNSSGNRRRRN